MRKWPLLILTMSACLAASADQLEEMNIKFMPPANCFAGSRTDIQALGGFAPSDNAPHKITDDRWGTDGQITLVCFPHEPVAFNGKYRGLRLRLINRTKTEAAFQAADSRLNIIQEAIDSQGVWKPVERMPASGCGNSEHRVFLPAGYAWEFTAPFYTGSMKTKLRFSLQYAPPIYSNEFEGSVNPEQFTPDFSLEKSPSQSSGGLRPDAPSEQGHPPTK